MLNASDSRREKPASEKRRQIGCTVFPLGSRVRGNDGTFCNGLPRGRGFRRGGCSMHPNWRESPWRKGHMQRTFWEDVR